jgi:hypothetical protein
LRPRPCWRAAVAILTERNGENIGDRALLDDDAPVHIGFAEFELGIDEDIALRGSRRETDRHGLAAAVAQRER